jgi:3D (Asp-Asp-Asp) domain-containing protein
MRTPWIPIAIAALALGCRGVPPREASEPVPRDRVAPAGECADAPAPEPPDPPESRSEALLVIATAYNSLPAQGVGSGQHGAWGDRLVPGMKTIAVSHDLLALGLTRGAVVRIEGLPGDYTVLDRLPRRWQKRIDIYMGKNVRAAREWGKRTVQIEWQRADQNVGDGSEQTIHIAK